MKRIQSYITDNQHTYIHNMSKATGLNFSEVLRRAVDVYIESERAKHPMFIVEEGKVSPYKAVSTPDTGDYNE